MNKLWSLPAENLQYDESTTHEESQGHTVFSQQGRRIPDNFKYKTNLFTYSLYEMRHIYGDIFYQLIQRKRRLADPFMKFVIPTSVIAFYLLSGYHFFYTVSYNNL